MILCSGSNNVSEASHILMCGNGFMAGGFAIVGVKSRPLTMSAVSSTFASTRSPALERERHFALVEVCQTNLGSLLIVGVSNSVRPSHLFDPNRNHDYCFGLPCSGERDAQSLRR